MKNLSSIVVPAKSSGSVAALRQLLGSGLAFTAVGIVCTTFACGGDEAATSNPPPPRTIVDKAEEPPGENCANGGLAIRIGEDSNRDGELEESEVDSTSYVCDGTSTVATTSEEPPGENCPQGGTRIDSGTDANGNGKLDDDEIAETAYVCDGTETVVSKAEEPPGENCPQGGTRIDSGRDANGNGELDDDEISSTSYVCDGTDALVETSEVPPGDNCPGGGTKIEAGVDENSDGELGDGEVDTTSYVCDGAEALAETTDVDSGQECPGGGTKLQVGTDANGDGTLQSEEIEQTRYVCDGASGLVETEQLASGGECAAGGVRIRSGVDADGDGSLQSGEVTSTETVCDGRDGDTSLVETSRKSSLSNCPAGGIEVTSGVDADGDGSLSSGEVQKTVQVCDGEKGAAGEDGANSLVESTSKPSACSGAGGSEVKVGVDDNGDGTLQSDEVASTETICNGEAGDTTLVETNRQSSLSNCPAGGVEVKTGIDTDGDGSLQSGEVQKTVQVCDGQKGDKGDKGDAGANSLVETATSSNCSGAGGIEVRVGVDDDGDGSLQSAEVDSTQTICNGQDGADGQDGTDGADGANSLIETSTPSNAECPNGGTKFTVGVDTDGDGSLSDESGTITKTICNGKSTLSRKRLRPAGCQGQQQAVEYQFGRDDDGDNKLADSEVEETFLDCGVTDIRVDAGFDHTCGQRRDGSVVCWGDDTDNEVSGPDGKIDLSTVTAGTNITCGINERDGSIECWGDDSYNVLTNIPTNGPYLKLDAGSLGTDGGQGHVCAVTKDHSLDCWGWEDSNEVSDPTTTGIEHRDVAAGYKHTCAITRVGGVDCWGGGGYSTVTDVPSAFSSGTVGLDAGVQFTCAWDADGNAQCWGRDTSGEVSGLDTNKKWFEISAGHRHACGITLKGTIECWGEEANGKVTDAPTGSNWQRISTNQDHTCAVSGDGRVYCWGPYSSGAKNPPYRFP